MTMFVEGSYDLSCVWRGHMTSHVDMWRGHMTSHVCGVVT